MPILKAEIDLFPGDLFERPERHDRWLVAYTRSRQEKALARYLAYHDVAFYLPQTARRRRRGGRDRESYLPLFPGYVFLPVSARDRRRALESNLIVHLIDVFDQRLLDGELVRLWRLQTTGLPLVPHPYLQAGDAVEVIDGPFKGCGGLVLREQGSTRLVVSITFLRRSVAATIDRDLVAPLSTSAAKDGRFRPRSVSA